MSDTAFALTHNEQIAYIKIETIRGKTSGEIFQALQEASSTSVLAYSTVCRWAADFKKGRPEAFRKPKTGRNISTTDGINTERVAQILNTDRRMTCEEIAHALDISRGSVHTILTERLHMRKIAARWVPHCLSEMEKQRRLEISRALLCRFNNEGENMLKRVVAIDETWIRSFEPELKRQSSEWHSTGSPRPVKYRRSLNNPKMLMIFAYDVSGVLTAHRVPTGQTVNKAYYEMFLRKILRPAIRRKRPQLLECGPLILHDNASCHKAGVINALMEEYDWEVLLYPAYSPDLSPPDFDLFPKLKEPLRGIRYSDLDELHAAVNAEVKVINSRCLATGITKLPHRWESVIQSGGNYIEGM